jgi:[ribosomal protein S5]-alanine N-acetyltransferase
LFLRPQRKQSDSFDSAIDQQAMIHLNAIETPRMLGRRTQPEDFDLLRQLLQNPQVAATLGGVRTDDEVREFLTVHVGHWERLGFGRWMWHSKADGRFVGRAGLYTQTIDGRDEIEVGYALMPEFWGQGLATEMARASIDIGFSQLGLAEIISFTMPTNLASRRVMEKCGLIFERALDWKNVPHVLYRLKR